MSRNLFKSLRFAFIGLKRAWNGQPSFRIQVYCAIGAIALLLYFQPANIWWALFTLVIGAVLSMELLNTSLEAALDRIHPESHPLIAQAKDCAAAAVLTLAIASLGVLTAFLCSTLSQNSVF